MSHAALECYFKLGEKILQADRLERLHWQLEDAQRIVSDENIEGVEDGTAGRRELSNQLRAREREKAQSRAGIAAQTGPATCRTCPEMTRVSPYLCKLRVLTMSPDTCKGCSRLLTLSPDPGR